MRLPSGDHEGNQSLAGLSVSLVCPVPSEFITYISQLPSRSEWNAMRLPSGDHEGLTSAPRLLVRLVRPVPSAFCRTSATMGHI